MPRRKYSDEQIIAIPREADAGVPVLELLRKHGIVCNTFYRWKAKHGGMEVPEARRLRALEDENRRLKRLVAATGQRRQYTLRPSHRFNSSGNA